MAKRLNIPIADMVARYQAGATMSNLASLYGCSYKTIGKKLIEAGVQPRPKGRPLHIQSPWRPESETTITAQPAVVWPTVVWPEPIRCLDCGERLDRPHVLGRHIPGCSHEGSI